jgi:hypothetical protein
MALVAAQTFKRQWIGIDISPTACRVMAKRLRDVCGLKASEPLWKIGRAFIVRDLPRTPEKLRVILPFGFRLVPKVRLSECTLAGQFHGLAGGRPSESSPPPLAAQQSFPAMVAFRKPHFRNER